MRLDDARCNAVSSRFSELYQAVHRRKDTTIYGYTQLSFKVFFSKIFTNILSLELKSIQLTLRKSGVTKVVYVQNFIKLKKPTKTF
jgi:hypothetical protein